MTWRQAARRASWLEGRATRERLPMPFVWARGRRWRSFLTEDGYYDFAVDVRELVCEPLQFERVAMWTDPRERLGIPLSVYRPARANGVQTPAAAARCTVDQEADRFT